MSLCSELNPGISGSPLLSDYLTANPSQTSAAQSSTLVVAIAVQA